MWGALLDTLKSEKRKGDKRVCEGSHRKSFAVGNWKEPSRPDEDPEVDEKQQYDKLQRGQTIIVIIEEA